MKFVEYVEMREQSDEAFLAELFANEEYNPEGIELHEILGKVGQWLGGLFNAGSSAATDLGRTAMNLPGRIVDKAKEYGAGFQIGAKIEKAKQLKNTMAKVQKALETDPDLQDLGHKKGLIMGSVTQINKVLDSFLAKGRGMQDEFAAQRKDRANIRLGPSSGDASTRAGGFDRRKAAAEEAKAGGEAARDAARRARGIA